MSTSLLNRNNLTDSSGPDQFKRVLLQIIIAVSYVKKWEILKESEEKEEPKAAIDALPIGITLLRTKWQQHRTDQKNKSQKLTRGGSSSYLNKLHDTEPDRPRVEEPLRLSQLIKGYNTLIGKPDPIPYAAIAEALRSDQKQDRTPGTIRNLCLTAINSHLQCGQLLATDFPAMRKFTVKLVGSSVSFGPPADLAQTIDAFILSGDTLSECVVDFLPDDPEPLSKPALATPTQPQKPQPADPKYPLDEYFVGHYLNSEKKPVNALIRFVWKNEDDLELVELRHRQAFWPGAVLGFFSSKYKPGWIIQTPNVFYMLVESTKRNFQQQLTIERKEIDQRRYGTYSSLMRTDNDPVVSMVVSGALVLQSVSGIEEADTLINALINNSAVSQTDTSLKAELTKGVAMPGAQALLAADAAKLKIGQSIRYQLLGQLISIDTSQAAQTRYTEAEKYVGRYVCQYMRLSKSPSAFETSHIEIFSDGTATLGQYPDVVATPIFGYVKLIGSRIWLFFGKDDRTLQEPIRFLVEKGESVDGRLLFKGVFSSQTSVFNQIVGGRMMMYQLAKDEPWPDYISIIHRKLQYDHFVSEKRVDAFLMSRTDPDIRNKLIDEAIKFFTESSLNGSNLTDGPLWAEVARRLQPPTGIDIIQQLCGGGTAEHPNNQFYYYTFKKDIDEQHFVIERNLVTFETDGSVAILAQNSNYKGQAFFSQKTLKLSLKSNENVFLEVFLDLKDYSRNLEKIKILYGMSLWHSGHRLQGKTVVLSRFEGGKLDPKPKFFGLSSDQTDLEALKEEDSKGGGVISYIRGEINRYMHTTTKSSAQHFRPRDKRFRELHFLAACFYGFLLKKNPYAPLSADYLKKCNTHLEQAFIHGYASDYAGLNLTINRAMTDYDYVKDAFAELYLKKLDNRQKRFVLQADTTIEIITRIQQLAVEQDLLLEMTNTPEGALNNPSIKSVVDEYWQELLKKGR